jgi:hypothetical protein
MERDIEKNISENIQKNILNQNLIVKTLEEKRDQVVKQIFDIDQKLDIVTEVYKKQTAELNIQKQPLEETMVHIDALLRLERGENPLVSNNETFLKLGSESSVRLTDLALEILKENGKPIHYKDLTQRIQSKGIIITGKDAAAILLSRISRDKRFKRTKKRGVYALKIWAGKDMSNNKHRTKRRR